MKFTKKIHGLIENKGGSKKFLKYLIVGSSAVIVDFAVFELLLLALGTDRIINLFGYSVPPEKIANTAAVIIGFFYSFILNRTWAFRSEGNVFRQILLMALLLAANTFISNEAISFMGRGLSVPFAVAKPIMQAAVAVWNYFIYDKIIYRR